MKKITGAILIMFACANVNAQTAYVQGGVNFANITNSNDGNTNDNNALTTFNAGIMGTLGLSSIVDLEAGLLFTGKGAKAETNLGGGDYVKAKFNPMYIELPVNLLVKFPVGTGSHLFVNAGPYVAVGVAGKSKYESRILGIESSGSNSIKFSSDDPTTDDQEGAGYDRIKRFDYGLNFGGGIAFTHFIVKANYGLGLAKISSVQTDNGTDDKNKFRTFSVSVGIPF